MILRSRALMFSMALVMQTTWRTAGGNAKNGITLSHARRHEVTPSPNARPISAFLKASEIDSTDSALFGPVTNCSMTSLGIDGIAAAASNAAIVVVLLGLHAPSGHAVPRTQSSGQAPGNHD